MSFYHDGKGMHYKVTPYLSVSDDDSAAKAAVSELGGACFVLSNSRTMRQRAVGDHSKRI